MWEKSKQGIKRRLEKSSFRALYSQLAPPDPKEEGTHGPQQLFYLLPTEEEEEEEEEEAPMQRKREKKDPFQVFFSRLSKSCHLKPSPSPLSPSRSEKSIFMLLSASATAREWRKVGDIKKGQERVFSGFSLAG